MKEKDSVSEKHWNYVTRVNRQKRLIEVFKTIAAAAYTSLWWCGIAFKSEFAYCIAIAITVLAVLVYVGAVFADEPTLAIEEEDGDARKSSSILDVASMPIYEHGSGCNHANYCENKQKVPEKN